jgi:hypothetical protein
MAGLNDLYQQNYGYTPNGPLAAWMQGQEDNYVKQQRSEDQDLGRQQVLANIASQEVARKAYAKQVEAQAQSIDLEKQMAPYRLAALKAQTEGTGQQNAFPAIDTLGNMARGAMGSGNMQGLADTAAAYERIKGQLPDTVRSVIESGQPNTYKNPATGQMIQSSLDPEALVAYQQSANRSRGQFSLDQQGLKNSAGNYGADARVTSAQISANARIQAAQIKAAVDKAKAQNNAMGLDKLHATTVASLNSVNMALSQTRDPAEYQQLVEQKNMLEQSVQYITQNRQAVQQTPTVQTYNAQTGNIEMTPSRTPTRVPNTAPMKGSIDFNTLKK